VRVGVGAAAQVHAAIAQVAQHVLDHPAAVLGREAVERAAKGVGEVRLVEHPVLVQRLDQDDVRRREAGANDYVAKPVNVDVLLTTLWRALQATHA